MRVLNTMKQLRNKYLKALWILSIGFTSCSENGTVADSPKVISTNVPREYSNPELIGEWLLQSFENDTSVITYNVCPKVVFNTDGTVKIVAPSEEYELYNYKFSSDTVIFDYFGGNKGMSETRYFEKQYVFVLQKNKNGLELKLQEPSKRYVYHLGK